MEIHNSKVEITNILKEIKQLENIYKPTILQEIIHPFKSAKRDISEKEILALIEKFENLKKIEYGPLEYVINTEESRIKDLYNIDLLNFNIEVKFEEIPLEGFNIQQPIYTMILIPKNKNNKEESLRLVDAIINNLKNLLNKKV
ncbi:MAG: hypothetical protein ACP5RT_02180 [Candidatus Micrarchaeia archaeon]